MKATYEEACTITWRAVSDVLAAGGTPDEARKALRAACEETGWTTDALCEEGALRMRAEIERRRKLESKAEGNG